MTAPTLALDWFCQARDQHCLTTAPQTVLASERKSGRPIRSYQYLAILATG